MRQSRHLGTITVRGDEYRFVFDVNGKHGCYHPILHVFRKGPNGSPAGIGPKGWPNWLVKLTAHGRDRTHWSSSLTFNLPCLYWHRAYKLRKIGGLKLYRAVYNLYHLPLK